jgi:acyl carrier protein
LSNVKETIYGALKSIQEENMYKSLALENGTKIVNDLGFTSLDVAQLIAMLEIELGVDPFAQGMSIMDVRSIGELQDAYEKTLCN